MKTPDELREAIEAYLAEIELAPELGRLEDAIRYAPDPGGKRVRPVLCLAVGGKRRREGSRGRCLRPPPSSSCTFSLVHDDLPALDDNDEQRLPRAPTSRSAKAPRCPPGRAPRRGARLALTYEDTRLARSSWMRRSA